MQIKLLVSFLLICFLLNSCKSLFRVKVGILLMTEDSFPVDVKRIMPALTIATEVAEEVYNVKLDTILSNYSVFCTKARYNALGNLADLVYLQNVSAFVGPACSYAVESAGRLAEYLRVPLVSGLGDLIRRVPPDDMFTTTTLLSYNIEKLSISLKAILLYYKWKHTAIIYDIDEVFFVRAGSNLVKDFRHDDTMARPYDLPFQRTKVKDTSVFLKEASAHARVFILLVQAWQFREMMWQAYNLGMAGGDYVFITIELFPSDWWGRYMAFTDPKTYPDTYKNEGVTQAYKSVLMLTLMQPHGALFETFKTDLQTRALQMYGYTYGADEMANYFIRAFYDAVIYLAIAYNETIEEGGDTNDGYAIARKFWTKKFEVPGLEEIVVIDQDGNRIADFDLQHLSFKNNQSFQVVGQFLGSTLKYSAVPGVSISWLNGLPPDIPPCGFTGNLCEEKDMAPLIGAVCGAVVVLIIICIVLYRYFGRNKALYEMRWKITWTDLTVKNKSTLSGFSRSMLSIKSKVNDDTDIVQEIDQVFASIGVYNGTTVAIRKMKFDNMDINNDALVELLQLHALRHNNLATFVGACVDPGHFAVITEYCPRGSLEDVIENESIELDWTFRHSLINDIMRGMQYLHNSDVKVHGRLRSSSCVVDSRFLLKLSCYGPKCFYEHEARQIGREIQNYNNLLWTAPELLRSTKLSTGTQKGDVYSFAIILQEIILRGAPFDDKNFSAFDIVKRVRDLEDPPFRPTVSDKDCPDELLSLMQKCWDEEPQNRPGFDHIVSTLKKLNRGKSENIMDNLMRRMEQYANNLEGLVEERTKAYVEEKKRAEDLLYRMLPQSVAKDLQMGKQVVPEAFDDVSIYFSDIVGFTTISARSTPHEVVRLLNDLYTMFDSIIDKHQVYKVETIGDAYMVASGLPERIGNLHAREISNMSLAIRHSVCNFKIAHLPETPLRIRIGLHSGAVVAGVVGLTMPRYCLFGDTVNTASRMESNGEAMKIHISAATRDVLETFEYYNIEFRGEIEVKGKGTMKTYWLHSSQHPDFTFL